VKCVDTAFDITEPQPQLFVAESLDQLTDVLEELENRLSFKIGGVYGLEQARLAKTVNTLQLDTGAQVSGKLVSYEAAVYGDRGEPQFIKFEGPVQICVGGRELPGQGRSRHGHGFSSPLGRWTAIKNKSPSGLSDSELSNIGILKGKKAVLEFVNGFRVEGVVQNIVRENHKILYITWIDCSVRRGDKLYYEPAWGEFDMLVGEAVTSVFGGPADRGAYGDYHMGGVSTQPGRQSPFTDEEMRTFECYAKIREHRHRLQVSGAVPIDSLVEEVLSRSGKEWLIALELLELSKKGSLSTRLESKVMEMLTGYQQSVDPDLGRLIGKGVNIAAVAD
jgi:phenylalanine-4-hydroxylase